MNTQRWCQVQITLIVVLLIVTAMALMMGQEWISPSHFFAAQDSTEGAILWGARLPRVLLGLVVGLALGSTGASFQALLGNPLADPYILGVSGGAALGSVVAVGLGLPFTLVSLVAFAASLASIVFIFWIANVRGRLPAHTLLLAGVIFNAFSFALILFINSLVSAQQAHQILYLLIGSLEADKLSHIGWVAFLIVTGWVILMTQSRAMNLLSLGDTTAGQLGVDVAASRLIIFFAASLMIGAAVSVTGLIGFVGLFVPHILRLILGPDHRLLVAASGLAGAIFLVACDTLARTVLSGVSFQTQLPVGVITALIGGPFFVYLLKRQVKMLT